MPRYVQIPFLASLLLLLLALPLIAAWRPTDRTCGGTSICLTSFKWCAPTGSRECYYPPNVYPQSDAAGPFPALVWEDEYEISWKGVRQDSGPVRVQWVFSNGGGNAEVVVWETELAALNNNIAFRPSASMFLPASAPHAPLSNITFEAAQGLVLQKSLIRVQQGAATANLQDNSDTFIVLPTVTRQIIELARNSEKRTWKKRMTVALVVGFLGMTAVAVVGAWFWMRWWTARMRSVRMPGRKIVD